jgi:hypothetical protein
MYMHFLKLQLDGSTGVNSLQNHTGNQKIYLLTPNRGKEMRVVPVPSLQLQPVFDNDNNNDNRNIKANCTHTNIHNFGLYC